jgi:intein/homing endonuclease
MKYIDDEFIPSFIRGYFDGDGSIDYRGNSRIIGTYELVRQVQEFFYKKGIIVKGKTGYGKITKNRSIYSIGYNSNNSIKFLDIIYKNSKIYLNRKYSLYTSLKNNEGWSDDYVYDFKAWI